MSNGTIMPPAATHPLTQTEVALDVVQQYADPSYYNPITTLGFLGADTTNINVSASEVDEGGNPLTLKGTATLRYTCTDR
jgi:hypothetical protein